jgi:hypothetical protein
MSYVQYSGHKRNSYHLDLQAGVQQLYQSIFHPVLPKGSWQRAILMKEFLFHVLHSFFRLSLLYCPPIPCINVNYSLFIQAISSNPVFLLTVIINK